MIHNQLSSSTSSLQQNPFLINNNHNLNNNNNIVQTATPLSLSDEFNRYTPPPQSIAKRSRYEEDFCEAERIGRGGYGSVFKVQNRLDGLYYALKKIPFKNTSQIFLEKVLREVKTLASLNHVNIVRYHSAWLETDDSPISTLSSSTNGNNNNSFLLNNQQQQQIGKNQIIDGFWGTSDHDDGSTLEIDTLRTFDNNNNSSNNFTSKQIRNSKSFKTNNKRVQLNISKEQDQEEKSVEQEHFLLEEDDSDNEQDEDEVEEGDDLDDSLNRLQFPSSFEELNLFQRNTKPESLKKKKQLDDSDSEDSTTNGKSLFRTPKQHFASFSLDEESEEESQGDYSDSYDDSDSSDQEEEEVTEDRLLPIPKSTTPPISMPGSRNGHFKQQSPPKSLNNSVSGMLTQRITTLFIVMQLYSQTLSQWLENRSPERIDQQENLHIFKQICNGLKYIHSKGIIHRDLKPGNIFLSRTDQPTGGCCSDTSSDPPSSAEGEILVSLGDYGLATTTNSPTPSPTPTSTPSLLPINHQQIQAMLAQSNSQQQQPQSQSSSASSSLASSLDNGATQSNNNGLVSSASPLPPPTQSVISSSSSSVPPTPPSSSLSRSSEHRKHTSAVGTLTYSSPEQKKGLYNEKTDIFSLGIILFELYHPFSTKMEKSKVLADLRLGIFPASFQSRYPKETELIKWMMKTNPDERPSACDILKSELFGSTLSKDEMELLIKQQQSIIEQLKQELNQLKSPLISSINHHSFFVPEMMVHNKGC